MTYFVVVPNAADDGQTSTVPLSELAVDAGPHLVISRAGSSLAVVLPERGRVVIGRDATCDVAIDDPGLSRLHAAVDVGDAVYLVDLGSSNGTSVAGRRVAPNTPTALRPNDIIELGTTLALIQGLPPPEVAEPVGARARALALAKRLATTELNVLLSGPAGTGKAHAAAELHAASPNRDAPMVEVACGRLSAGTLEELAARPEATLLLRHVDATPRQLQGKLLNLVNAHRGRVFATTRVDLELAARRLEFYGQLLTAIRQVQVELPELAECRTEINGLAGEFVDETARAMGLRRTPLLTPDALQHLTSRDYPENVRSLRLVVQRTVAACDHERLSASDLVEEVESSPSPEERERQRILDALAACGGNQTQAAKMLSMSRRTLVSRLDKYKIVRPRKSR